MLPGQVPRSNGRVRIWRKTRWKHGSSWCFGPGGMCPSLQDHRVPIFCWILPSSEDGFWNMTPFTVLQHPPQSPHLNPIDHLWDLLQRESRTVDVQMTSWKQLCDATMAAWTNTLMKVWHERWRQVWRRKGVQHFTSEVYLTKWPVSGKLWPFHSRIKSHSICIYIVEF